MFKCSIYRFSIRSDVFYTYKCVASSWMQTGHDENVVEWFPLKNENMMVKVKDHDGLDDNGYSKKLNSQPCHLGSFNLSESKRFLNDVSLSLDGFINSKIYYSDTDSIYIHRNDYKLLQKQRMIGKEIGQSKNDYDDSAAVVCDLFLAPKIKDCIFVKKMDLVSQKITIKDCDQKIARVGFEHLFDLEKGKNSS